MGEPRSGASTSWRAGHPVLTEHVYLGARADDARAGPTAYLPAAQAAAGNRGSGDAASSL
jgi:hypothetical protein